MLKYVDTKNAIFKYKLYGKGLVHAGVSAMSAMSPVSPMSPMSPMSPKFTNVTMSPIPPMSPNVTQSHPCHPYQLHHPWHPCHPISQGTFGYMPASNVTHFTLSGNLKAHMQIPTEISPMTYVTQV